MTEKEKQIWAQYSERFGVRFNPLIGISAEDITRLMEKAIARGAPLTEEEVDSLYDPDLIY